MYKYASKFFNSPNKPELTRVPDKAEFEWAMLDRAVEMIVAKRYVDEIKRRARRAGKQLDKVGGMPRSFKRIHDRIQAIPALEDVAPISRHDVQKMSKSRLDRCLNGSASIHRQYTEVGKEMSELCAQLRAAIPASPILVFTRLELLNLLNYEQLYGQLVSDTRAERTK